MNSQDREKILERIRKLLKLAENRGATRAEATAAALAAQRLIAQYDVEQWELHSEDAEPIEKVCSKHSPRKWRWYLADVIAPAFRCRFYQERSWGHGKYLYKMVFFGYKTDATAAKLTYDYLYKLGNRLGRKYSKGMPAGTFNSYIMGFVDGVRRELEKQCVALLVVTPKKVNEEYDRAMSDVKEAGDLRLECNDSYDGHTAYIEGRIAGRDSVRSRRLDEDEAELVADAPQLAGDSCA